MVLRTDNNPYPPSVLFPALGRLMIGNTQIAQNATDGSGGTSQIFVQKKSSLGLPTTKFPCILLQSEGEEYAKNSLSTWIGSVKTKCSYYARWDRTPNKSKDDILATMDTDMRRMASNLQDNESIVIGIVNLAVSIVHLKLSPYEGADDKDAPIENVIRRWIEFSVNILPYDG